MDDMFCSLLAAGVAAIANLGARNRCLKKLSFCSSSSASGVVVCDCVMRLFPAKSSPNSHQGSFDELTDDAVVYVLRLAVLCVAPRVLSRVLQSSKGCKALANTWLSLDTCSVTYLDLSHNRIDDVGCEIIASALRSNVSLTYLSLRYIVVAVNMCCRVGDVPGVLL